MNIINLIKKNSMLLKTIAIILFFVMFIYSGVNKILKFNNKTKILQKKINLPYSICAFGMILVILLEIIGSLIIYYNLFNKNKLRIITNITYLLYLLFLIVVTFIYHPPTDKLIPFLSNLTTFAGLLYLYADFLN